MLILSRAMKSRAGGPLNKGATAASAAACLALSLLAFLAFGRAQPASSDVAYSTPAAPTDVAAKVVRGGLRVSWTPSPTLHPTVSHYSVGAGRGTCPVTVGKGKTSAIIPLLPGRTRLRPFVTATNAYGQSPPAASEEIRVSPPRQSRYRNVQIIQFSDFHGAIEASDSQPGAAKLATAFAKDRTHSRATFTVSSGDTIGGAPVISSYFREIPAIRAANGMDLDVSTFGNHEHDRPLEHLREMISRSNFRWTVSNYDTLDPLQTKKNQVKRFTIIRRGGIKLGIVGMNTEDTPTLVAPGNLDYGKKGASIAISRKVAPVNASIAAAKRKGADVVVALLHQGWQTNQDGAAKGRLIDVAKAVRGADIAFGGHTHQHFISNVNGMPVAEPRNSGQEYLRTQICLDTGKGRVVGSTVVAVPKEEVEELTPDPSVQKMVDSYSAKIGPIFDRRVGVVADVFPRGGTPPVERTGETALGDLAADSLKSAYGTELVFVNGGGIRDTLPAAGYTPGNPALRRPGNGTTGPYDVALGDIKSVFPFGNNAATTTISGTELWAALEHAVSSYPSGRFPQISGFKFTFDLDQPAGSRITTVTKTDGTEYTVTTLDYIAFGGDGFGTLFDPVNAKIRSPYDELVTHKLEQDLAANVITPVGPLDGRITCVGAACVPR